jgi:curli biogenesis system outer membrane secretion channel CsgG
MMEDVEGRRTGDAGAACRSLRIVLAAASAVALAGCLSTTPTAGGAGTVASGSAGGATAQGENTGLEKCTETLGTMGIDEDRSSPWYYRYSQQYKLESTVPLLRLIVQQSNCFVVVERGSAFNNMMRERQLRDSGEMRAGSSMQQGQIVAADYTMKPSITFSERGTGGAGAVVGGLLGSVGSLVGGSMRQNEASTTLLLIDNRSGVQLAAAEGSAQNMDFGLLGGLWGGGAGGVGGAYGRTPEGKVLVAAFVDSYNNMVKAVRNYKAQQVRGGLGTGGALGVQGGQTPASQAPAPAPAPAAKPAAPTTTTKQPVKK